MIFNLNSYINKWMLVKMKFLGRENDLAALETEYKGESAFVVIYGRRRVGKTTLIREFIRNKNAFYYLATKELEQAAMAYKRG